MNPIDLHVEYECKNWEVACTKMVRNQEELMVLKPILRLILSNIDC